MTLSLEMGAAIRRRLQEAYPSPRYELNFSTPFELLIATILAAQCTDERVNMVTATLFTRYPDPMAFVAADRAELEESLKMTGFYRQKAKSVQGTCQALLARFDGRVPTTMEALTSLPGVARKTANVVLNTAFGIPSGIIVDTHVARVSRRLGLTLETEPERIEKDLMEKTPVSEWIAFGAAMVLHGRYVCKAKKPSCGDCTLAWVCERQGLEG